MLKQFMIEKIDQEQLTETTGTIVFHIVDENGDCRKVSGRTFLDENQEAKGITAESIRELPLIESLFSHRDKKIVEVEFDHFNKVYDRETNKTINTLAYEVVMKMKKKKSLSTKFTSLFNR